MNAPRMPEGKGAIVDANVSAGFLDDFEATLAVQPSDIHYEHLDLNDLATPGNSLLLLLAAIATGTVVRWHNQHKPGGPKYPEDV